MRRRQDTTNFINSEYIDPIDYNTYIVEEEEERPIKPEGMLDSDYEWEYGTIVSYYRALAKELKTSRFDTFLSNYDENELNSIYSKWDNLPFRESRWEYWTRVTNISGWSFPWHKHYFSSDKDPYKIRLRVLKSSVGDSFDNAFSKYCKLVKPRYHKEFKEEFTFGRLSYYYNFYLDENRIIRVKPKTKKNFKLVIRSKDFQTVKEYVHKIIGDKISKETFENLPYKYGRKYGYFLQDQYEEVIKVVKGYEFETSYNDYRYKRYKAELDQKYKAEKKLAKKEKAAKIYDFMTEREKFNKVNALDKQKLQAHGFDDNSFKRHHGRKYRKSHKLEENG